MRVRTCVLEQSDYHFCEQHSSFRLIQLISYMLANKMCKLVSLYDFHLVYPEYGGCRFTGNVGTCPTKLYGPLSTRVFVALQTVARLSEPLVTMRLSLVAATSSATTHSRQSQRYIVAYDAAYTSMFSRATNSNGQHLRYSFVHNQSYGSWSPSNCTGL
jgi:hypothetical protein